MSSDNSVINSAYNSLLQSFEHSNMATLIRQSAWLYPILEIIHIVGIVLLAGGAIMFDLRLIGYSRKLPAGSLALHLLPWSRLGLLMVVPSGILLFITNAETLGYDITFWIKIILICVAGVNAGTFHLVVAKNIKFHEENNRLPSAAKAIALLSISLWLAIIACGRLLAY